MYISELVWDAWNEEHIANQGVEAEEVEQVILNEYFATRARSGKYRLIGRTDTGRYLAVILGSRGGGIFYVVTARDATHGERRLYGRR